MTLEVVQKHFDRIQQISDQFRKTLEDFAEDGVITTEESRQVKQHLITYRDIFQRTRHEVQAAEGNLRAEFDAHITEATAAHGEDAPEVARLRIERFHNLRPFELMLELTDRMLELMANVPRPSYAAARDMHEAFTSLADKFRADIEASPRPRDTQAVLAVNVVEMQLAHKAERWQRLLEDVRRRAAKADESPLQKVYLKGMQAALQYVLDDLARGADGPPSSSSYDGLLPLDYRDELA